MSAEFISYRKHLRAWYKEIKKESVCSICGRRDHLQFHHLREEEKIDTISNMIHKCSPIEDIETEMGKCIILCRRCHVKIHKKIQI